MATSLAPVVDLCRHMWTEDAVQYTLDPYTAPLPFREKIFEDEKPLTIGFYMDDGFCEVSRLIHVFSHSARRHRPYHQTFWLGLRTPPVLHLKRRPSSRADDLNANAPITTFHINRILSTTLKPAGAKRKYHA